MLQSLTPEQEKKVKYFKRQLESWREFLVVLSSVLLWEKPWFPALLMGILTSIFTLQWYWQPSVLTTLSVIALIATLLDYIVPVLTSALTHPDQWTALREKQYETICESIVSAQDWFYEQSASLKTLKDLRPKTYFALFFSVFLTLAWLGNVVNNLLLTYVAVSLVVLSPGMKRHKVAQQFTSKFVLKIASVLRNSRQEKVKRN